MLLFRVALVAALLSSPKFAASAAGDEESPSLALLDRESLAGWRSGERPSRGWTIADGVLSGAEGATPLLSGWTWGDFELSFRFSTPGGAALNLLLPEAPAGQAGLVLSLAEGERAAALTQGDRSLAAGQNMEPTSDGWHAARVRRAGDRFSLSLDGRPPYEVSIPASTRYGLGLAVGKGRTSLTELRVREPAGEPIYNGKDLAGWWTPGKPDGWAAEAAGIVCLNKDGNYLRTEKEYGNFTLSLAYKMAQGGNSGIGIRTARAGWPSGDGMELQLLDEPPGQPLTRHSTMALYGNLEPIAKADRSQAWNRLVVKAEGYLVSAWVNGVLVQQADTSRLPELHRRNLKGWIGLQDHNAKIEFRDLRVLESPDGPGLEAWYAPRLASGSKQVLDRLMNSENLALDDHLRSGTAHRRVARPGEQVLAELTGPGAVVEIWRSNDAGRIGFYFDGEQRPRIHGSAAELPGRVPRVGQDQQPLLTFLPYQKSLKVVLEAEGPAEYRLDYVTLPDDVPLTKFVGGESGVERGLLPALSYRNEQLGWGTHREADPLPRRTADPTAIQPGARRTLVELSGAGVVQWTKLQVDPAMLANDDLWLEATVDGRTTPAILAPARYLYPGLAGDGKNYPNYVLLDRGGLTNMLAMPYRNGLSLAAINRGQRPIASVGATVSYEPIADPADARLAARLHGVFQPGGSSEKGSNNRGETISQSGRGRWVGLVVGASPERPSDIESLVVDGKPLEGYSDLAWNAFWGVPDDASEVRRSLSGRRGGLAWRYLLLAPIDFRQSLALRGRQPAGDRLALFYLESTLDFDPSRVGSKFRGARVSRIEKGRTSMRIAVGGVLHETSTFIDTPTTLDDFEQGFGIYRGAQILDRFRGANMCIGGFLDGAATWGFEPLPLLWAFAYPSGLIERAAYDALQREFLERLRQAEAKDGPVDGVLLDLHGAMVVEGAEDGDGDFIESVRRAIGPGRPIVVAQDLHGNHTARRVAAADAIVGYDTYPHVDMGERGREAAEIMVRTLRGEIRPQMALRRLPLFWGTRCQVTAHPPMDEVLRRVHELERRPGMISVTVATGFPWADVPDAGVSVIAVADGDPGLAQRAADELGDWIWEHRERWQHPPVTVREALAAGEKLGKHPILLADHTDNTGGGAPGDSTEVLRTFLELGLRDALILYMVDREAVAQAQAAGVGARIGLELGGKSDPRQGPPVACEAEVAALSDGRFAYDGPMYAGLTGDIGPSAWLKIGGVSAVVVTKREQPLDPAFARTLGIDCRKMRYIGLKSSAHFRSGFERLAGSIHNVDAAGILVHDFAQLPYRRRRRPLFPLEP